MLFVKCATYTKLHLTDLGTSLTSGHGESRQHAILLGFWILVGPETRFLLAQEEQYCGYTVLAIQYLLHPIGTEFLSDRRSNLKAFLSEVGTRNLGIAVP